MCAHNYEVDVTANQMGQIHQRIRVATDTCTLPPENCCVPLAWFSSCCKVSQLDVVQSSCYLCTGNPVDHPCSSQPLHLPPPLPKAELVALCLGEAQIGWTQLPGRLLGLGFCFGQAVRFYDFFWKEYIDEWLEYVGGLIAWGLYDWLEESMVTFQLILVSTGSGLLCQSRGFLNCIKGTHPPWW